MKSLYPLKQGREVKAPDDYLIVDGSRALTKDDIGKVLFITAVVTLTYPTAGITGFRCNATCSEDGEATFVDEDELRGLDFPDGAKLPANKMCNLSLRPDNLKLRGLGGLIE